MRGRSFPPPSTSSGWRVPDLWLWMLPVVALLLHLGLVRYNLRGVQAAWDDLAHRVRRPQVADLEDQVALTALLADDTLAAAETARAEGALEEARRLLALACAFLVDAVPDRLARVRAMARCCRMLAALAPVPPLVPRDFRARSLRGLALVGAVVHHFLASVQERFRWGCLLLGWGYRLVRRGATRASAGVERDPAATLHWRRFANASSDFKVLDVQHVRAFAALLAGLALADPESGEAVARPAPPLPRRPADENARTLPGPGESASPDSLNRG